MKKTLAIDSIEELNIFIDEMANTCKYVSEKEKHAIEEERLRKEQEQKDKDDQARRRRRGAEEKKVEKVEPVIEEDPRVDLSTDFRVDPVLVVDFLVEWMSSRDERKRML